MVSKNLKVANFLSDGTHQVTARPRVEQPSVSKLEDVIHLNRNMGKEVWKRDFSCELLGSKDNHTTAKKALSNLLVNRCAVELKLFRKKFSNDKQFFDKVEKCRVNLVNCLSGEHKACKKSSMMCRGYGIKDRFYGTRHMNFTPKDAQLVLEVIDYKLGADKVKAQRKILDTNKIKAIHNRVFRLCSKSKTQKRTLKARNFNAALIDSVQLANSIVAISKSAGFTLSLKALLGLRFLQNRKNMMCYAKEQSAISKSVMNAASRN